MVRFVIPFFKAEQKYLSIIFFCVEDYFVEMGAPDKRDKFDNTQIRFWP